MVVHTLGSRMVVFTSTLLICDRNAASPRLTTWFVTLGLRHTFALWQRALALVESLLVHTRSLRLGRCRKKLPLCDPEPVLSNPYQPPDLPPSAAPSRWLRSVITALLVWCCFIFLASALGAFLSFYTGKAAELPNWNGWSYLMFSAKEGAMFGAILSWPLAIIALILSLLASRRSRTP